MRLEILLKSDLCTSSGENFNSFIDTDVVYDDYGFPYIPAKRLKGVLKEAALELVDFGLFEDSDYQKLFGTEGKESALFTIDDAYLKNHEDFINDIHLYLKENEEKKEVVHPQRVLELYTYTRTQTAMTKEGVAKENSLRTFRVVNAGETFISQIRENGTMSGTQKDLLRQAALLVKHIGNNRTRGFGQVEMNIPEEESNSDHQEKKFHISDKNVIDYKITLKGPVLCKTGDGNQEHTENYIQGSKVLGILAEAMGQDSFLEFMGHKGEKEERQELIVSNAYICAGEERCTPMPSSYQKKKDQDYSHGRMYVKDMLSDYRDEEQWTPLGAGYIAKDGTVRAVETQINYHHKRPEDKAFGRATGADNSSFYQLRSICKGQAFQGYIIADRKQAEMILEKLHTFRSIRIGNSRNAEYGNAVMEILHVRPEDSQLFDSHRLVVKLNSAAVLYNDYGMPTSEISCLTGYLEKQLGLEKGTLKLEKCFASYEDIGGFNVTWHSRKPCFTSLGKGSVFLYHCDNNISAALPEKIFIGERVSEGYGEAEISDIYEEDVCISKYEEMIPVKKESYTTSVISRLEEIEYHNRLREAARRSADECVEKHGGDKDITATLGKLLLLSKTVCSMDAVKEQVDGIEKESKKELAQKVYGYIDRCDVECTPEKKFRIMLPEYLTQLKYKVRAYKKGKDHVQ